MGMIVALMGALALDASAPSSEAAATASRCDSAAY
jgi:hypothetical protein